MEMCDPPPPQGAALMRVRTGESEESRRGVEKRADDLGAGPEKKTFTEILIE